MRDALVGAFPLSVNCQVQKLLGVLFVMVFRFADFLRWHEKSFAPFNVG
jgi:hypothetical protein